MCVYRPSYSSLRGIPASHDWKPKTRHYPELHTKENQDPPLHKKVSLNPKKVLWAAAPRNFSLTCVHTCNAPHTWSTHTHAHTYACTLLHKHTHVCMHACMYVSIIHEKIYCDLEKIPRKASRAPGVQKHLMCSLSNLYRFVVCMRHLCADHSLNNKHSHT